MTNKEWLKNITPKDLDLSGNVLLMLDGSVLILFEDYYWLIKQAERVQELENHIDHLYDNNVHLKGDYRLQEQNKRYQKAIKECVERMNAGGTGTRSFVYETLKKALEGEREMNEFCPTCSGSGGIEVLDGSIGEVVTIPCPDCGGSGESY